MDLARDFQPRFPKFSKYKPVSKILGARTRYEIYVRQKISCLKSAYFFRKISKNYARAARMANAFADQVEQLL